MNKVDYFRISVIEFKCIDFRVIICWLLWQRLQLALCCINNFYGSINRDSARCNRTRCRL